MNSPSDGVPPALLHHVHLVSLYRYPSLAHLPLETVVDYLLQAPKITREVAGMSWIYLDAPHDGSVMLVWQPPQLGTHAASDGYIWADPEAAFSSESRGYTVEMYLHRSGFHPPHEQMSTHSRRRYRLTPAANPNPNLPACDSSLWIIHYCQAEPQNRIPSNRIPLTSQSHILTQRKFLQQQGQLARKEFMLHDRSHWPTINLPGGNMPNYGSQQIGYTSNVISHLSQSQQQSYLQQQQQQQQRASANQSGAGPSPAKRLRQNPQSQSMRAPPSIAVTTIASEAIADDEEDNPKDLMDFLTPKDISITRFVQHHEWIEEVFNSPYSTGQIIPGELGIGRKGEIEALTRDFFNAPTEGRPTVPSESQPPRVGRLAPGKAEDFSKKVSEKLSELNSELEEMKRRHSQRMADAKEGGAILDSEKLLRSAPMSLASKADEWIFDGSSRGINLGDITTTGRRDTVDEIARKVEGLLGKKIVEVKELECIEQGGLEEKTETMRDDDLEYQLASPSANTNQLQDQSAPATAPQQDTPSVDPIGSVGHTPQPSTADVMTPGPDDEAAKTEVFPAEDITMEELPNMAGRKNSETGSWVMVNDETVSGDSHDQHMSSLDTFVDLPAASPMIEVSGDHADSPGDVLPSFTPNVPANATDEFGANDFGDFSNLDSAGEALSGYEGNASIGLDEHGDLGLDDSAFGDAFHATEASAGARPDMAES